MRSPIPKLRHGLIGVAAVAAVVLSGTAAFAGTHSSLPHPVGGYLYNGKRVRAIVPHTIHPRALPDSVDLRANMPAVGNQGQVGSCVEWAIAYGLMGYYANTTNGSGAPYAPLYLYMRVVGSGAPNNGTYPTSALNEAQTNGVDTQADYTQGTTGWQTAPTAGEIANAANYKITGHTTLWYGSNQGLTAKTAIETAMAAGSPVAIAFPVYMDFEYIRDSTLYNTLSGSSLGGHMVAAVGYDSQGIWIRNSWGTWWGASGDAHLSWAFVETNVWEAHTISGITTPNSQPVNPPTVSGLSVKTGPAGTSVTISGTNLSSATAVNFGTASAQFTPSTTNGVTKLVATAPAHDTGTAAVTVTNPAGTSTSSSASTFTYTPSAPTVTGLSPTNPTIFGGSTVTVTGTSFVSGASVKVGTAAGTSVKVLSKTSLSFVAPALAVGAYDVMVKTTYGTSATSQTDQLTYVNPPAPALTSLKPASGSTYKTTDVTITGTDLKGVTGVTAGGTSVKFTKVSDTQVRATLPVHVAGAVDVQVTTPGGTSPTGTTFTYVAPPVPSITGLSPSTGYVNASRTVTVTGSGFAGVSKVTAGGASVSYTAVSDGVLRVTLPQHAAGGVDIQVTTPGGTSSAGSTFTYTLPPSPNVTALSVKSSPNGTATSVVVSGSWLTGTTQVTVDGVSVKYSQLSDSQLRVNLPAHSPGTVTVQVTTAGGTSSATSGAQFTYGKVR